MSAGKGDKERPRQITKKEWDDNFTSIDWSKHKKSNHKEIKDEKEKSIYRGFRS